jgi:hypothetical protein
MPPRSRTDPGHGQGPPLYPGSFFLAFREAATRLRWQVGGLQGRAVRCTDAGGSEHVVALENLYRSARRAPRTDWATLIAEFLDSVSGADLVTPPTDLTAIVDQLLPRVGPPFPNAPTEAPLWKRPLPGTGLVVNLVVDFPNRMVYVADALMAASDLPADHWYERALANLRSRTPASCFQSVHAESGLQACATGDAYDSARALILGTLLPPNADGYFVGVPNRDSLLVLPVSAPALAYLHLLKLLVEKNYRTAPYPLTDEVYWVRDGTWGPFPMHVRGERVLIQPPDEFNETLKRLLPSGELVEEGEPTERLPDEGKPGPSSEDTGERASDGPSDTPSS